jgi:FkbH-like protein
MKTDAAGATGPSAIGPPSGADAHAAAVKCLVWDLDHTMWEGILLEDPRVSLRPAAREVLETLDRRGILHSIASRNDPERALAQLRAFGLDDYFLHPQIGWEPKPASLRAIAAELNIGLGALAFIDDDPFERDQVRHSLPCVRVFDALELERLPRLADFRPRFITEDACERRRMYRDEIERREAEATFDGPPESFLATLEMRLTIASAAAGDLERAEELTQRTHQLNSTGYTYSHAELDRLRGSPDHQLLIAALTDRYGSYGKIGLALLECAPEAWTLKLLLVSCRVMSRGVGSLLLKDLLARARRAGVCLRAEFIPTATNRPMLVALRFAGFREIATRDGVAILEAPVATEAPAPAHVEILTDA